MTRRRVTARRGNAIGRTWHFGGTCCSTLAREHCLRCICISRADAEQNIELARSAARRICKVRCHAYSGALHVVRSAGRCYHPLDQFVLFPVRSPLLRCELTVLPQTGGRVSGRYVRARRHLAVFPAGRAAVSPQSALQSAAAARQTSQRQGQKRASVAARSCLQFHFAFFASLISNSCAQLFQESVSACVSAYIFRHSKRAFRTTWTGYRSMGRALRNCGTSSGRWMKNGNFQRLTLAPNSNAKFRTLANTREREAARATGGSYCERR